MAKVTAPLFGFNAAGSVGQAITFATWRGVKYSKRYTTPSNPRSTAQTLTRDIFTSLNQFWKLAPSGLVEPWTYYASGRSFLTRNAFIGQNIAVLRNDTPLASMETMIASPGSGGGSAPSAIAVTPGSNQLSLALTLPDVPTGWTLTASRAIAFIDQAPSATFSTEIVYNRETTTPQTNVITGLTASELYVVAAFLEWTKPDGTLAFSVGINDTGTPTA